MQPILFASLREKQEDINYVNVCFQHGLSRSRSLDRVSRYRFVRDCFTLAAITRARCRPGFRFHEDVFANAVPAPTCKRACASARNNTSACTHIHCTRGKAISHCRWRRYGTSYWLVWSWVTPRPTLTLTYYLAARQLSSLARISMIARIK